MTLEHRRPPRQDGYDQVPAFVQQREDLPHGAKCLYGLLQSVRNMKIEPDYRWLAAELGASARSIIRWVKQLVGAGLIAVTRRGQGLTNLFTVLALVVTSGSDRRSDQQVPAGHRRPESPFNKRMNRNNPDIRSKTADDYYQTSEGRLPGR